MVKKYIKLFQSLKTSMNISYQSKKPWPTKFELMITTHFQNTWTRKWLINVPSTTKAHRSVQYHTLSASLKIFRARQYWLILYPHRMWCTYTISNLSFSLSFEFGIFPDSLKTAKIIPIFKTGPKTDINNYRPISLLSNFSKILVKLIYTHLSKVFEKSNIIHQNQYGFWQNLSTTHAMLDILSKINNHMNKKKFTGLIFLNFRKAFDTVLHDILLKKLHHYSVRGVVYNLLKSYLTEHKQFVYINGSYSTTKTIQFGVPQGSNLGPILFSIHVNDIFNIFDLLQCYMLMTLVYMSKLQKKKI